MLTEEQITNNRHEIISLLRSTGREGIDVVINYLVESGFFERKGSQGRHKHHDYKGGLAEHSLGVYRLALYLNEKCNPNSVIIAGLLHDICKANSFKPSTSLYHGHGLRSVNILQDYLKFLLTDDEREAILFHMHGNRCECELAQIVHSGDWGNCGGYPYELVKMLKGPVLEYERVNNTLRGVFRNIIK